VTIQDAYPLPRIDESLDALAGSKFFSTLDLLSGYWQVPVSPEAQNKAAFITRDGLCKWKVLPFGLTSAPATFQQLMEQVLSGLLWKTLFIYLDDVIVISPDFDTHVSRLREVFDRLQAAGLKLKPSKCALLQQAVKYLGHVVGRDGVTTDPEKVRAVRDWAIPVDLLELRAFLGLVGYYRQYIPDFAGIAQPLNRLTAKGVRWQWMHTEQQAFSHLKDCLVKAPILVYPDPAKEYILDTDASNHNMGAVLSQVQDGREVVVAYYSKALSAPEMDYCTTRREPPVVVKVVKHFRQYLYGRTFRLQTDHASLIWLCRRAEPSSQAASWLKILTEFSYRIEHRPGKKHGNADGLSRHQADECKQCQIIERRDGGPPRSDVEEQLGKAGAYSWEEGQLRSKSLRRLLPTFTQSKAEQQVKSAKFKYLCDRWDSLRFNGEGLLTITLAAGTNRHERERVVCPSALRRELIWDTHKQAHVGAGRVTRCLQLQWFWPGMTRDVRLRMRACKVYQASRHGPPTETAGRCRLHAGRPRQVVAVDLLGPMLMTVRGNNWILVLTDHFTRWADALAISDASAPTVARAFDQQVFCYFGLPEQIHSDQGAQFQSQVMSDLCKTWGVNQSRTTPYHPQGYGVV